MPRFTDSRLLPYTPEQLVDLVADVKRYPEFLPWCQGARIYNTATADPAVPRRFDADLIVGFKAFRQTMRSRVEVEPGRRVSATHLRGPLRHLEGEWLFAPEPAEGAPGCRLDITVDFSFKSRALNLLISDVFGRATEKMIAAFEARAKALYG